MIDSLMTLFLPRCYLGLILSWNRDQVEFSPEDFTGACQRAGLTDRMRSFSPRDSMYFILVLLFVLSFSLPHGELHAQSVVKKVRMGIQSTNIGFLPFHVAYHKGFYREQGIDLETIFMSTQAVNAAFVRGDIDYSAAVNGIIQTIVRGAPAKILACAVDRPLQSFVSRKEIRSARELKGKKIGGSTPGGTATLMADLALKHLHLEPGRDVDV